MNRATTQRTVGYIDRLDPSTNGPSQSLSKASPPLTSRKRLLSVYVTVEFTSISPLNTSFKCCGILVASRMVLFMCKFTPFLTNPISTMPYRQHSIQNQRNGDSAVGTWTCSCRRLRDITAWNGCQPAIDERVPCSCFPKVAERSALQFSLFELVCQEYWGGGLIRTSARNHS